MLAADLTQFLRFCRLLRFRSLGLDSMAFWRPAIWLLMSRAIRRISWCISSRLGMRVGIIMSVDCRKETWFHLVRVRAINFHQNVYGSSQNDGLQC